MDQLIKLTDVSLNIHNQSILKDVSLSLNAGETLTIIGPNGAGKSSLIKLVLNLIKPSQGKIWHRPNLKIGYLPQKLHIDPIFPLTVQRFLKLAHSKTLSIQAALKKVGALHLEKKAMHALSGGEMQRVLLARAIIGEPNLLVLDEPNQGVDIKGQSEIYALIKQFVHELGCGVLLVSHDLHFVMASTDQVLCLNQSIRCSGLPKQIAAHPEFARLFGRLEADQLAIYKHAHHENNKEEEVKDVG